MVRVVCIVGIWSVEPHSRIVSIRGFCGSSGWWTNAIFENSVQMAMLFGDTFYVTRTQMQIRFRHAIHITNMIVPIWTQNANAHTETNVNDIDRLIANDDQLIRWRSAFIHSIGIVSYHTRVPSTLTHSHPNDLARYRHRVVGVGLFCVCMRVCECRVSGPLWLTLCNTQ